MLDVYRAFYNIPDSDYPTYKELAKFITEELGYNCECIEKITIVEPNNKTETHYDLYSVGYEIDDADMIILRLKYRI